MKAAIECTPPFAEAGALNKVDQAFKQDHGDMAIWHWLGVHPCNDTGTLGGLSISNTSLARSDSEDSVAVGFIRDQDSEFKKSDMPKAMRVVAEFR